MTETKTLKVYNDKDEELVFTECKINIFKLKEVASYLLYGLELVNVVRPIYEEIGNTESSSIYALSYAKNLDDGPTAYVYTY